MAHVLAKREVQPRPRSEGGRLDLHVRAVIEGLDVGRRRRRGGRGRGRRRSRGLGRGRRGGHSPRLTPRIHRSGFSSYRTIKSNRNMEAKGTVQPWALNWPRIAVDSAWSGVNVHLWKINARQIIFHRWTLTIICLTSISHRWTLTREANRPRTSYALKFLSFRPISIFHFQ